jgi:hypothetical protein
MTFQNGQTALVLNYETATPVEDKKALRAEAEEVWGKFRHHVEGANLPAGILRPVYMESSGMFVKNGKGYGFVIERGSDGQWRWLDEDK